MRKSVAVVMLMWVEGCAAAPSRGPAVAPGPAFANTAEPRGQVEAVPSAPPSSDAARIELAAPRAAMARGTSVPTSAALSGSSPVNSRPARPEMLDIEANLHIEVDTVAAAADALRAISKRFDGLVVEDTLKEQPSGATARITIRVPSQRAEPFLDALTGVGRVRSREVSARDIGKEYFDAELRLENLTATMKRYEEILKQAKDVNEILRVEAELSRLRAEVEQTKGNLRWLGDRAARATVHVNLSTLRHEIPVAPPVREPQAKLYPGLRLTELTSFGGERGTASYLGAGLSATFSRHFALHLDGLRAIGTGSPSHGLDVVLLSIGGEMFSDYLGGGKRTFMNPYLGYNAGYARFTGQNEGFAGITAGVELWKTKNVVIDAEARAFVLIGAEGAHGAIQPAVRASIAF